MTDTTITQRTLVLLWRLGLSDSHRDINLYTQALTPPHGSEENNRQLELVGDAYITAHLIEFLVKSGFESVGRIASKKDGLVSNLSLCWTAKELGIDQYIITPRLARESSPSYINVMASALEALVGATHLDQGYEASGVFVREQLFPRLTTYGDLKRNRNSPKHRLEMRLSELGYPLVEYQSNEVNERWKSKAFSGGQLLGKGAGPDKKSAEQQAAGNAIASLKGATPRKRRRGNRRRRRPRHPH